MLVLFLYKEEKGSLKGTDQLTKISISLLVAKFAQIDIRMSNNPQVNNPMGPNPPQPRPANPPQPRPNPPQVNNPMRY